MMELDIQTIARRVENLKIRNAAREARMQDILAVRKGEIASSTQISFQKV